jgi:hypothetical protein
MPFSTECAPVWLSRCTLAEPLHTLVTSAPSAAAIWAATVPPCRGAPGEAEDLIAEGQALAER